MLKTKALIIQLILLTNCSVKYNLYEKDRKVISYKSPNIIGINDSNFIIVNFTGQYFTGRAYSKQGDTVSYLKFDTIPFNILNPIPTKYLNVKNAKHGQKVYRFKNVTSEFLVVIDTLKISIHKDTQIFIDESTARGIDSIEIYVYFMANQFTFNNGYMDSNIIYVSIDQSKLKSSNLIQFNCSMVQLYYNFQSHVMWRDSSYFRGNFYNSNQKIYFNKFATGYQITRRKGSVFSWLNYRKDDKLLFLLSTRRVD